MVRNVDDAGFLEVITLGEWDLCVVQGHRVTIHTEDGDIQGVIGSPPPHCQYGGEEKPYGVQDIRIDLGLGAETVVDVVGVGDVVTMKQRSEVVGEHITGKAIGNRSPSLR